MHHLDGQMLPGSVMDGDGTILTAGDEVLAAVVVAE